MPHPELLRDTLREVLYGPVGLRGLFSEPGQGLLHAAHAFTAAQARAPHSGQPSVAARVMTLRQTLQLTAATLADPHALLGDPTDPRTWAPADDAAWRAELVALAGAGQALYDALYRPLSAEGLREAHGAVVQAAREAAVLRFIRDTLPAG
ncbi:hypothetical protein [Deinococcus sp. RIT780]|uniref:hypothetical protein n=1 Tax=Deinococcus sp. RIT780 TaxID=2870472 RepID=UPI001C8A5A76|nr:hypothetical protein [Deinococcus sp. RIT780]MBX8466933.1 hypothetical protein [Deinococcus sp. RIT780]